MIKYIDPTFKFFEMEKKLIRLHTEFNLKREKHKIFLSWASKFHIAVDVKRFSEELRFLELSSDTITAKYAL